MIMMVGLQKRGHSTGEAGPAMELSLLLPEKWEPSWKAEPSAPGWV